MSKTQQIIDTRTKLEKVLSYIGKWAGRVLACFLLTFLVSLPFGTRYFVVLTGSMEPTLPVGSIICVVPTEIEDLKVGDIITRGSQDTVYVTHRIIKIEGDNIYTKGDASNAGDGIIKNDTIYGRVVFCSVILGQLIEYVKDPICFIWILTILSLTYAILQVIRMMYEVRTFKSCLK